MAGRGVEEQMNRLREAGRDVREAVNRMREERAANEEGEPFLER